MTRRLPGSTWTDTLCPDTTFSRSCVGEEIGAHQVARPLGRAFGDEHADPALDRDQPFVLKRLIRLGDRQRIRAFLRGERAHRGEHIAVAELTVEDRVGDDVAQTLVYGFGLIEHAALMRSEEHTSELQSLMRISYAVFGLKKTKQTK